MDEIWDVDELDYFDRKYGMTGKSRRKLGLKRDYMGRVFYNQHNCNDRNTHPYSFSEIIHWQDGKWKQGSYGPVPDVQGADAAYSDRLSQRDWTRYFDACRSTGEGQLHMRSRRRISKLLTYYFGRETKALGLVEGCNQSSGYPYYIFFFKHVDRAYKDNEYTQISVD
jgi:hypothetical protein